MQFKNLADIYERYRKQFGVKAYQHISEVFREAKELHRKDFLKNPTKGNDHEQSWRAFKGKNLERLIEYIIKDEVTNLGLKVISGNTLERTNSANLSKELSTIKRNLLVDYGEFGSHLPDVDLVIYEPRTYKVIAVVSSKVTLRERIAQTGYWKIKLSSDKATKHIKVFFITPDEDKTLSIRNPAKKGRAIVEIDTDGSYVMTEEKVEESQKVKTFDKFILDLKDFVNKNHG